MGGKGAGAQGWEQPTAVVWGSLGSCRSFVARRGAAGNSRSRGPAGPWCCCPPLPLCTTRGSLMRTRFCKRSAFFFPWEGRSESWHRSDERNLRVAPPRPAPGGGPPGLQPRENRGRGGGSPAGPWGRAGGGARGALPLGTCSHLRREH